MRSGPIAKSEAGVLRHSNAFAICMQTIAAKTIVDSVSFETPSDGRGSSGQEKNNAAPIGSIAIDAAASTGPRKPKARPSTRRLKQPLRAVAGRTAHGARLRGLRPEREGGQQVRADVEREHLQHGDHERDRAARHRPDDERRQLGDVVGEVVGEEPPDVLEGRPPLLDGLHDVGEVVVEQHEIGRLAGDVGADHPHRDADVRLAQRRARR